jgi:hypothetical protein
MSQTPDAFPQSDVGTEIAPETWVSEDVQKVFDLNLTSSCWDNFDSFLHKLETYTTFDF